MKKKNIGILLYLYIFFIVYTPVFNENIIFNNYITIPLLAIVMLIPYIIKRDNSIFKMISNKKIMSFFFIIFISSIYYLIIYYYNTNSFSILDSRIVQNNIIIFYSVHICIILEKLKRKGYEANKLINILIKLGAIQGIICIIMAIFPNIREIALNLYYLGKEENIFISGVRIYGISLDYTFATPIYHGLIGGFAFSKFLNGEKKNIFYSLLILLAIFVNGRTGVIIYVLTIAISSLLKIVEGKKILKILKRITLIIILFLLLIQSLKIFIPNTYNFIKTFANDTTNLIFGEEKTGNYDILSNTFYLPDNNKILFGQGIRVYGEEGTINNYTPSDIGYVNDLFMGGIIYCILIYTAYIYFISSSKNKIITASFIMALVISNYKGEIFRAPIIIFAITCFGIINILNERNKEYGKR